MSATRVLILVLGLIVSASRAAPAAEPTGARDARAPTAGITLSDQTTLEASLLGAERGVLNVVVDGRRRAIPLRDVQRIDFRPLKEAAPGDNDSIRVALVNIEVTKKEDAPKRLDRIGANWEHIPPATPLEELKQFDVVYFPAGWGKCAGLDVLADTYHKYLDQGGGLLFSEPDVSGDPERAPALRLLPYPIEMSESASGRSVVQYHKGGTHALTEGIDAADLPFAYDYVRGHDPRWTVLAKTETNTGSPTLLACEVDDGRVVLHTNPDDYGHLSYFKDRFVVRIVKWLSGRPPGDIQADDESLGPRRVADFVERLDRDYSELLDEEPQEVQQAVRRAEGLLRRDAQQSSTWTSYADALQLIRRHRSKAAAPMLLKLLADDRLSHGNYEKDVYRTLAILTGRPPTGGSVKEVAEKWWFPQRKRVTVDPAKMEPGHLKNVVRKLLEIVAWGESYLERERDGMTPYRLYHLIMYGADRYRWSPEDFHDAMIPHLLDASEEPATRFTAMVVLAALREADRAPDLDAVVEDAKAPAACRTIAAIALWKADKLVRHEALISVLRTEMDRELKIAAIITLGHSQNPAAVETVVGCLRNRDTELREAAIWASYTQRSPKAVQPIAEALRKDCRYRTPGVRWAVRTLGEIKTRESANVLAELMETTWEATPGDDILPELLDAFEAVTDQHFQHRSIPRKQPEVAEGVRKALYWWKASLER